MQPAKLSLQAAYPLLDYELANTAQSRRCTIAHVLLGLGRCLLTELAPLCLQHMQPLLQQICKSLSVLKRLRLLHLPVILTLTMLWRLLSWPCRLQKIKEGYFKSSQHEHVLH